jgi:hypothetical protein
VTLFIVLPACGIGRSHASDAAALLSAAKQTSVMRRDSSTFPAATALAWRYAVVGDDEVERAGNAVVDRHVVVAQHTQHKHRRGTRDGGRRIHIAAYGRRCAREIDPQQSVGDVYRHDHRNRLVADAIAFKGIGRTAGGTVQLREPRADAAFGVAEQRIDGTGKRASAQPCIQRLPTLSPSATGSTLRAEIALAFGRGAHVGEHETQHIVLWHAGTFQPDRRHDESFLKQLGRPKRHAARTHATDIRMMRADRRIPDDAGGVGRIGNHLDHGQVGQMRATMRRIVEQKTITRHGTGLAHGGDRFRHRPEMHGDVRGLRNHPAVGIEQRARGITPFANIGRDGAALEQTPHLFRQHRHALRKHRQIECVERRFGCAFGCASGCGCGGVAHGCSG